MRRYLLFLAVAVVISTSGSAQRTPWQPAPGHITLTLWPRGAPGAQPNPGPETDITTAQDPLVAGKPFMRLGNVSTPTLTLYTPAGSNSGAAVVVFPGGAYHILAMDDGTNACDWLNSAGIVCVLIKYRVPDSGPYPKSSAALQDAQRAVGIIRSHAVEWHIDPNRIGVLGFSAGAHLAAALSTHFDQRLYEPVDAADQQSSRPDFTVIVCPAYIVLPDHDLTADPEIHATSQTPPTFILQAEDDPVRVENSIAYFLALKNAKVPAEMHIYAQGGHGSFMPRTELPITGWPQLIEIWLHTIRILPSTPE